MSSLKFRSIQQRSLQVILGLSLCAWGITGCQKAIEEPTPASVTSSQPTSTSVERVSAGQPAKKTLQLFTEQPGKVLAYEEAPILSKLAGYVSVVNVDIGQRVTKGQTLIAIDAPEYKDQLEQKRGLLAQAQAHIKQAQAEVVAAEAAAKSAESAVAQAESALGKVEAEFARWESENRRMQQLASTGSVTPKLADETASQFQAALAAKKEVLANVASAQARLSEFQARVLTSKADAEAAHAKLKVAAADIALAETMLGYTEIKAPFDGYVASRHVDSGHYVQPANSAAQPLLSIVSSGKLRVVVNVPETEAVWVDAGFDTPNAGDPATITAPSQPGQKLEARIARMSRQLDSQSHSLTCQLDLVNDQAKLLPGSYVTVKILLEQRDNVVVLPIEAIVTQASKPFCCVVQNGKIEHQPLQLGLRVGDEVEVTSGLNGSETVVLARAASLQPGQSVELITKK